MVPLATNGTIGKISNGTVGRIPNAHIAFVQGSTNGSTNGIPISFKVLPTISTIIKPHWETLNRANTISDEYDFGPNRSTKYFTVTCPRAKVILILT